MSNNEEQAISDREKRAWLANKNRGTTRVRPVLDRVQRIEFLELVAQMSGRSVFERKLSLNSADIEFYKQELDIESPDEARRLASKLKRQGDDERDAKLLEQTQQIRNAEEVAQARLEALETKRAAEDNARPRRETDINKVRQEDAERQRRFADQQESQEITAKAWNLPMEHDLGSKEEQADRFRREIMYRGLSFVNSKYGTTSNQVKIEAKRLGLSINWDIVRR
jgi:hypothetical protein